MASRPNMAPSRVLPRAHFLWVPAGSPRKCLGAAMPAGRILRPKFAPIPGRTHSIELPGDLCHTAEGGAGDQPCPPSAFRSIRPPVRARRGPGPESASPPSDHFSRIDLRPQAKAGKDRTRNPRARNSEIPGRWSTILYACAGQNNPIPHRRSRAVRQDLPSVARSPRLRIAGRAERSPAGRCAKRVTLRRLSILALLHGTAPGQ